MNSPLLEQDDLASSRDETFRLLQSVAHYCRCAQMHLEVADDAGALWDFAHAKEYFKSAVRQFEPVRAAMRLRTEESGEAA